MSEKLKDLVDTSTLSSIQKLQLHTFIDRATDRELDKAQSYDLIARTSSEKANNIVISTNDVKIFTVQPTGNSEDWSRLYPYRVIYKDDSRGKWRRVATVSPTLDVALLVYLSHKHLGEGSQFTDFAAKMLNIKID